MIKIIGAGMAGLLAANLLRRRQPVVYEQQGVLPHNHSAVLRFRSPLVGEVLGVPFRRVRVLKSALPWRNPVADAMAYSRKVIGEYRTDRSILPGTELVDRWIAPPDLIERMAEGINVKYETEVDLMDEKTKVISTIPMPNLMLMLNYHDMPEFGYVRGVNIRARLLNCDAYLSMYVPDPGTEISRVSVTGDEIIVELQHDVPVRMSAKTAENHLTKAMSLVGVHGEEVEGMLVREQAYSKIRPIDETVRRDFIHWASSEIGRAFSLGRYATWRPGLLLDDLVQDVRIIDRMIDDRYTMDTQRRK